MNPGPLKELDDFFGSLCFSVPPQFDLSSGKMMNLSGIAAVDANVAKASEDSVVREVRLEKLFVSEAVLEGEKSSPFREKGRKEIGKDVIRCRLQGDYDEVDGTDLARGGARGDRIEDEISVDALDVETSRPDGIEIPSHEEGHVFPAGEPGAVVASDGPGSDDGDLPDFPHRKCSTMFTSNSQPS
jgi:hypothetical protein